jgi:NTE family protein
MTARQDPPGPADPWTVAEPSARPGPGGRESFVAPGPTLTRPSKVAFVLQGGGSLCAPQVGMLRALIKAGIRPDLVVGSSAGALNGAAFAADPTTGGLDRLEALWRRLTRRRVLRVSPFRVLGAVVGRSDALVSNAALRDLIRAAVGVGSLEGTPVPVHVVAADRETGEAVVLSRGDTVPALLASAAFPGLYPSVRVGERNLVDGRVAADLPIRQAEALGATVTYVLPSAVTRCGAGQNRAASLAVHRAMGHVLEDRARRDSAQVRGTVLRLPTVTSPVGGPLDFSDSGRMITDGYFRARAWLARQPAAAV